MFGGAGPDLLGVCEVENKPYYNESPTPSKYLVETTRSCPTTRPDARGIDVSFILDANTLTATDTDHQVVVKRTPTRDLFCAKFHINSGPDFAAFANHWPSRSAGQYKSEPFRMLTGETLAFVIADRLFGENGDKELPIIVMGDFNDEPFNRSMQKYLLGTRDPGRVRFSKSGHLLNLMWPLMEGHDPGTIPFPKRLEHARSYACVVRNVKSTSPIKVKENSIVNIQTVRNEREKRCR